MIITLKSKTKITNRERKETGSMLALLAEYELLPAAEGHLRDLTPYIAVRYATTSKQSSFEMVHVDRI